MCQPLRSSAHNLLVHRSGAFHCHVMPVRIREGGNREADRASKGVSKRKRGGL